MKKRIIHKAPFNFLLVFIAGGFDWNTDVSMEERWKWLNRLWKKDKKSAQNLNTYFLKRISYKTFLELDYWKTVAWKVKNDAKFRCRICNSPHYLNVHHRSYKFHGIEHLHLEDLICICNKCHKLFHFKK